MDKSLIQVGQLIVDNIHKTNSPYQFTKDVPYTFELSSAYRNLSSQDMSSSSSTVLNIISSLNTYGTYWNKAMNFLPTSLFGSPFHIKNVSSSKSKIWKMKPDYLSIGNISNNYVKVSVNNGGGSLKTTFTTSLSVDQSFNFDIIYTNPGVSSGKSNNAGNLIASSILGLWDLDNASTHTWVVSCPSQMDTCKMGIYTCTMNILADSSFTLTTQIKTTYYNITFKDLYDQNICQVISDGPNTDVFQNINYSGKVRGNNMIFDMDGDGNLDQLPIIKFGPELYITLNLYVNALKQNRPFDLYFNK